ncbi:MAG: ABC transporter substrate-binding protein [Caldimonas sp.]
MLVFTNRVVDASETDESARCRRRSLCALLALTLALPQAGVAQPRAKAARVAVFTFGRVQGPVEVLLAAFRQGMRDLGYNESRNVEYQYLTADENAQRLDDVAQQIVASKPDVVLVAALSTFLAIKRRTSTIPIVMPTFADPVASGYVESYSRPGGNVTGLSNFGVDLTTKRLEILLELLPDLSRLGVLWDATGEYRNFGSAELRLPGRKSALAVVSLGARTPEEIDEAVAQLARERVQAVAVAGGPLFNRLSAKIAQSAMRHRLPTMFGEREDVVAGGLMSYGQSLTDRFRRAAVFVDKIIKGANPGDLPIEQSSTIELVINLRTARALGLAVPQAMLVRADEIVD